MTSAVSASGADEALLIHPDDREQVEGEVKNTSLDKQPYEREYRVVHASGEIRWVFEQGRVDSYLEGVPQWLDGVIIDISERKKLELRTQESEARYRLLFENSADALMIFDIESKVLEG